MAPQHRFVDRDAFARFGGIGVGCQRFQATRVLDIQVGPDCTTGAFNSQPSGGDLDEPEGSVSSDDAEGNEELD